MGYNTPVLILNDAVDLIPHDPLFPQRLLDAVRRAYGARNPIDVPVLNHVNAVSVFPSHHADDVVFIAFGANGMAEIGRDHWSLMRDDNEDGSRKEDEFRLRVLKSIARQMGYSVRKTGPRRKKLPSL